MQSVLDLRIMRKDCKKEAKDFNNGVHELAYTLGQVSLTFPREPPLACTARRARHFT